MVLSRWGSAGRQYGVGASLLPRGGKATSDDVPTARNFQSGSRARACARSKNYAYQN
jgi:hypothetical protein